MTDRKIMEQALEALWNTTPTGFNMESDKRFYAVITALRERLAQPEQCQCPECQVTPHASDCAVHNEPAYPNGACNCRAQPARQPEQEPVAWIDEFGNVFPLGAQRGPKYLNEPMKPLYTSPPASKPLTDEELEQVFPAIATYHEANKTLYRSIARAIEAKLKEKNNG